MARDRKLVPVLLLLFGLAAVPVSAGGDANLWFGGKWLSDDELADADVDQQTQYGVALTLDFDWSVDLAFDLTQSSGDDSRSLSPGSTLDTDVDTTELALGVRKLWGEKLRPYVGGGLVWIELSADQTAQVSTGPGETTPVTVVDDSGDGLGLWLNAGVVYLLGSHFNVGLDLRYSQASVDLQPVGAQTLNLDAGGVHAGLLLGYHW